MTSSASSSPTTPPAPEPPSFFVDRSLGVTVTQGLTAVGWRVTSIDSVFEDHAQGVADEEWIEYGGRRGWALLTKDKRIRRQPSFERAITPIFALSNGNISLRVIVQRFDDVRDRIWRNAQNPRREFWVVYENRVERQYP